MEFIPCLKQLINYNFYHIYYRHAVVKVVPLYHTLYIYITILYLVGGFNPLKNIGQLGVLFPIYGKKYAPNHRPDIYHIVTTIYIPSGNLT